MTATSAGPAKARIALLGPDDFVETVWVEALGDDRYRLHNIPFFAYGVSSRDVVEARWRPEDLEEQDEDDDEPYGFPYFERVVEKSGHATLRLAAEHAIEDAATQAVLAELRTLGCGVEGFPPRLLAIDVPPHVALDDAQALLARSGLTWENGDPPTEHVPGRAAYVLRRHAAGDDATDAEGATDIDERRGDETCDLLGAVDMPPEVCAVCNGAMRFVLRLHAHEDRLRLRKHRALSLSVCGDCTAHRIELHDVAPESLAGHARLAHERREERNPWAHELPRVAPGPHVDKLGGYPEWAQREEQPCCPTCGRSLWLVAQLGSDTLVPLLGRRVVGYFLLCPEEHAGVFIEQLAPV